MNQFRQRRGDPGPGIAMLMEEHEGARLRFVRAINGVGRPPRINRERMGLPNPYGDVVSERVTVEEAAEMSGW